MLKENKNTNISNIDLVSVYKDMLELRLFEESIFRTYREGKISGFCHLYTGQEAVITGCHYASLPADKFITSYRCHAHSVMRGISKDAVFRELLGKKGGSSKGKGGSMHLFDPRLGFFGGHGIVGAQVPIGTGLAFASKYYKKDEVSFVFFGDGAANQGQVYESFNLAKILNLPVIFIIENNVYAMGTSVHRSTANYNNLWQRGSGFGIKGTQVDGMDFFAVYEAAKKARSEALKNGPVLLELLTYRYKGHSMSDPAKYRSREELNNMRDNKDPIQTLEQYILKNKLVTQDGISNILLKLESEIEEVKSNSMKDEYPDLDSLYTDVY